MASPIWVGAAVVMTVWEEAAGDFRTITVSCLGLRCENRPHQGKTLPAF